VATSRHRSVVDTWAFVDYLATATRRAEFDQLWRMVSRFMRCLPTVLFEGRNLVYDIADVVKTDGAQVPNPIWPYAFCMALRLLILHPFFRRSPALLALVV
jgi:hypothetical protein